ncbi:alpha/beta hydrolase [Gracilibacillus oryzae]|uniref:Alpha/beta hydrolase n=1 Tax=Gracilibacillus oryzae TaxID=1672701 RepID=A0A7C8GRW9_9BACI|nr:alpha/beta fold hydrolase [Gracilibacillus oryzae]KAB8127478.1 alpha/beta hydrolase [Gracilibacillus oryzae]
MMQMTEIKFKSDVMLSGTINKPEENDQHTIILFIPGSGKVDRDGNANQKWMNFSIYKQLADFLISKGFTTFRYDKRGVGKSEGDHLRTGLHDAINDVQAAIQYTRNTMPQGTKIMLLGHSEGTMIATAVAAREMLDGIILLSGGGETFEEASARQRELAFTALKAKKNFSGWLFRTFQLDKRTEKKNQRIFAKIKNTDKDVIRVQGIPFPAKWAREHFAYDLLSDLKKISCPVLAITGAADIQSDYRKLERLKDVNTDVKTYVIEDMDHLLKEEKDDVNILEIKKIYQRNHSKPIHPELKERLAEWLTV